MSEQSVEVVKRAYVAFAEGDVAAVLGVFADEIEWLEAEGMPYGGVYRGGEAVLENVFGPVSQDIEGYAVTPEKYLAAGDTVAVVVHYTGTGKVTGKRLDLSVVHEVITHSNQLTGGVSELAAALNLVLGGFLPKLPESSKSVTC